MLPWIAIPLAAICFAAGHLIRDGWPGMGGTQQARIVGGSVCSISLFIIFPWLTALAMGIAVTAGFWLDHDHAAGQGAKTAADALNLTISGLTSVALAAIVGAWFAWPWGAAIILVGFVKPAIWFVMWRLPIPIPTQKAAGVFGAILGAAIVWSLGI